MISKKVINDYIRISDLLDEFGLKYINLSGKFTHKLICPSPDHSEKTASFYVNGDANDYYCYGCGIVGKALDFYIMCKGCSYSEAMTELSVRVPKEFHNIETVIRENNFEILIKIKNEMRKYIYNNQDDLERHLRFSKKIDEINESIDRFDLETSEKLLKKVKSYLGGLK